MVAGSAIQKKFLLEFTSLGNISASQLYWLRCGGVTKNVQEERQLMTEYVKSFL